MHTLMLLRESLITARVVGTQQIRTREAVAKFLKDLPETQTSDSAVRIAVLDAHGKITGYHTGSLYGLREARPTTDALQAIIKALVAGKAKRRA